MITPTCSKCRAVIRSEDVNVANDLAYCRACNLSYKLSELTTGAELADGVDLRLPPAGATYRNDGAGTVVSASHRALGSAMGVLFFALFWNGIVSVFVLLAISGTMHNLHINLPDWFPAPKMNGGDMGVGMTLFLWIFLTPFITIGVVMMGAFLSCVAGRTEVRIHNAEGVVFTGIGSLGYRRRFDAGAVKDVRIDDRTWRDNGGARQRKTCILIETREGKLVKFGTILREDRRKFVASAVRKALLR